MNIEIINMRNYPVNDKLKAVLEKKIQKLDKFFDESLPVKLSLKKEGENCKLEISLNLDKQFLKAYAVCDNMYDAVDKCIPKIEKQILKYRSRFDKKLKKSVSDFESKNLESEQKIVKTKEFELQPMEIEEAIFQMDFSGHDFYVFLEEQSQKVKVLYKRFDGDYGLINPKI